MSELVNITIQEVIDSVTVTANESGDSVSISVSGNDSSVVVTIDEKYGIDGEKGEQGPQGERGERGLQGLQGDQGETLKSVSAITITDAANWVFKINAQIISWSKGNRTYGIATTSSTGVVKTFIRGTMNIV